MARPVGPRSVPYGFAIVGIQKAATTSLASLLFQHPQVAVPPRKERHFFDDDFREWDSSTDVAVAGYKGYAAKRRSPEEVMTGDCTPSYLFHPLALRRLRRFDPDLRLIAVFRDPLERLFSQWLMLRARNVNFPDWPRFIHRLRPRVLPRAIHSEYPRRFLGHSGVARGYYGQQLERGLTVFPREHWLLLEFGEVISDHAGALDRITDHLQLDRFTEHPSLPHAKRGPELVRGTAPTATDLVDLAALYAEDLQLFEKLSAINVDGWATRRILDGRLDAAELAGAMARKVLPD